MTQHFMGQTARFVWGGLFLPLLGMLTPVPAVQAIAGLYLLIVQPTVLLHRRIDWHGTTPATALLFCCGAVTLTVMAAPFVVSQAGVAFGIERPLAHVTYMVLMVATNVALFSWRRRHVEVIRTNRHLSSEATNQLWCWRFQILLAFALTAVVLSVCGAIRLNNGHSGHLALAAAGVVVLTATMAVWQIHRIGESCFHVLLYLIAAAALLATSLRGWLVTGHDIQQELRVAEALLARGRWAPDLSPTSYSACLSISTLPAMISAATGIDVLQVFKVVFQLLFACVPGIVFEMSRRWVRAELAAVSALLVVIFPTFAHDMPFLNRQEIAFVFLGLVLLASVQEGWSTGRRRLLAWTYAAGIGLAHYSTNYVFMASLAGAWCIATVLRIALRGRSRWAQQHVALVNERSVLSSLSMVLVLAVLTLLWTGPVTQSGGQVRETVTKALRDMQHDTAAKASSDVKYSLINPAPAASPQDKLNTYVTDLAIERFRDPARDQYYPQESAMPHHLEAADPVLVPLTGVGQWMADADIPPAATVERLRSIIALLFQVFMAVGLLGILWGRSSTVVMPTELFAIAIANGFILVTQIAVPQLSVDYGVLRAFQQSLFVQAAVVAAGMYWTWRWLAARWALRAVLCTTATMHFVLSGVGPSVTGGGVPRLSLANAGPYYQNYSVQPGEWAAMHWLHEQSIPVDEVHREIVTDRYNVLPGQKPLGVTYGDDISVTLMRRDAYVMLGAPTVRQGRAAVFYSGDVLTYQYPIQLLQERKSLVYSTSESQIYR